MTARPNHPPGRTLLLFACALAGSVTGILAGPRMVGAAEGTAPWLLPLVMAVCVLLGLVGAQMGVRMARRSNPVRRPGATAGHDVPSRPTPLRGVPRVTEPYESPRRSAMPLRHEPCDPAPPRGSPPCGRHDQPRSLPLARWLGASFAAVWPGLVVAANVASQSPGPVTRSGVSALWILANFSYAGMRAQDSPSTGWRILAFIFGFPGTLVSLLAVTEGSGRVYGVQLPPKAPPDGRS